MKDAEHLRLLSIFYYIFSGLTALSACIPIFHVTIGLAMVTGMFDTPNQTSAPPPWLGWLLVGFGSLFILVGWAAAISMFFTARFLKQRRKYVYCLVVAGLSCVNLPFGTALGVCTIIVLMRPTVKTLFESHSGKPVPARWEVA